MTTMKIEQGQKNKILRTTSQEVGKIDDKIKILAKKMLEAMNNPEGFQGMQAVGLAAPQVGENLRIIVIRKNVDNPKKKSQLLLLINPKIIKTSQQKVCDTEGCLSVPETFGTVSRHSWVVAQWQNLEGNNCEHKFTGMSARVVQHEIDHLDGVLFTDKAKNIYTEKLNYN